MATTFITTKEGARPVDANRPSLPSLRRNVAWTMSGNVIYSGCQWLMLVILAKLGTTDTVGTFALAIAIAGPIMMLANLQLRWVQATDRTGEFEFNDCLTLRSMCSILAILAIFVLSALSGYSSHTCGVIAAIAFAKAAESFSDVIYGWYQQHERMELISQSLMVRGPLSVAAMGIGYFCTQDLLWATWALAATWTATLLLFDVPTAMAFGRATKVTALRFRWRPERLRRIFIRSLPVGLTSGVVALEASIPRFVVEQKMGTDDLGVFAAMAYILMAAYMVIQAVNQSALPRLAKYRVEQNVRGFRKVLWNLVGIGIVVGLFLVGGTAIFGRIFLYHAYSPEYARQPHVLTAILLGCAIMFAFRPAEVALLSMRRFWLLLIIHACGLPLLLANTHWLVGRYGLWGAAGAMIIQAAVHGLVVALTYAQIGGFTRPVPAPTFPEWKTA